MSLQPKPPARFRFSLVELLLFAGLTFLGLCVLSPIFRYPSSPCLKKIQASSIYCSLFIVSITAIGFSIGLFRANGRNRTQWARIGVIIFGTLFTWLIAIPLFAPPLVRSRTTANMTAAAAACKGYAEAQEIYHRTDYDGDAVLEYAQKFRGNDSLMERTAGAQDLNLVDVSFAAAEGLPGVATPKAGYVFKILKAQGPAAPGGARSYLVPNSSGGSDMTGGYALIAQPAEYDVTGCGCFMINNAGTVYESDLGEHTAERVAKITEFNPDPKEGWAPTE